MLSRNKRHLYTSAQRDAETESRHFAARVRIADEDITGHLLELIVN